MGGRLFYLRLRGEAVIAAEDPAAVGKLGMETRPHQLTDEGIAFAFDQQLGDAALHRVGFVLAGLIPLQHLQGQGMKGAAEVASGVADQLGEHLADTSSALHGEFHQSLRVLVGEARGQDGHLGVGVALVNLDVARIARIDRLQEVIEVAGLGIGVCPGILSHNSASKQFTLVNRGRPTGDDHPARRLHGFLDDQGEDPTAVGATDQKPPLRVPSRTGIANDDVRIAHKVFANGFAEAGGTWKVISVGPTVIY